MKKTKLVSLVMSLLMTFQVYAVGVSASAKMTHSSVTEAVEGNNMIVGGALDKEEDAANWSAGSQKMRVVTTADGGYLECSGISVNYAGFTYQAPNTVEAGVYKFTGYIRTLYEGELTWLRVIFSDKSGTAATLQVYPTSDKWLKVETYITFKDAFTSIKVLGGPVADLVQSYCLDSFSLVKVDKIPDGISAPTTFGTPVSMEEVLNSNNGSIKVLPKWDPEVEAQYKVEGLVVNQDADGFISGCVGNLTREDLANYARSFAGSHITDYMICVNNTNATFPSETWTDLAEKYHQTVENGKPVDYKNVSIIKGAYNTFEALGLDYIDIWCETFPEVGINPWISFRMNDAHDLNLETSHLLSNYFHEHPEIRRVQSGVNNNTYYAKCQDYSHKLVRDHMLDLLNEALSRYDCYGIELDFQREIWLWDTGSEYAGIDILNGFFRDVEAVVAKYEEEYGHEIKIGVRCASDIATNYDFGLDVMTWAKEGIIDMICPTARWGTTDNDVPVRSWCEMLEPYGVEVWPGIESRVIAAGDNPVAGQTFNTLTATAASYLSQGAAKVYLYNHYRGISTAPGESDRVSTLDPEQANSLSVTSNKGYWNMITTIGSYEKLMKTDRRMILTSNDTNQLWSKGDAQLPRTASPGRDVILHIPVGDIPKGSDVIFKFGVGSFPSANELPEVYVNGELCERIGSELCEGGYTESKLLCYRIPAAAYGDVYMTVEIKSPKMMLKVKYAEVYVTAPENAVVPTKASTTPSSWATAEVVSAIEADIVPDVLMRDYTDKITRSEFCTLIMTMINKVSGVKDSRELLSKLGFKYVDSFTDTDSADVIAANLIGIVNGRGDGVFDPFSGITRQEAAKMLSSAAGILGIKGGVAPEFADIGTAAAWAVDSIRTTASIVSGSGKNVMGGVGANRFDPLGAYTREQSVLTVYRLFDSIKGDANISVDMKTAVPAVETLTPVPNAPGGVGGIVIRADSDEVDVNRLKGTDVTDAVLTLGSKDASTVIKALRGAGIKVYISIPADNAVQQMKDVLGKYDVNGIEIDFVDKGLTKRFIDNSYNALDTNTDMLEAVSVGLASYETKYGHSIKVAVRVPSDVMNSFDAGLNVTEWALKGLIDTVSPSALTVTDTDMHTRLWYSLMEDYGVDVVPFIGKKISVAKGSDTFDHTPATLANEAYVMLSQGASKVGVSYSTVDDASLKVLGTYEKLAKVERRAVITYSDTAAPWLPSDAQAIGNLTSGGVLTVKAPVGDIGEGRSVTVRIAYTSPAIHGDAIFNVYANSEKCTHVGDSKEADSDTGYKFCTYTVPTEALGDGQLVIELWCKGNALGFKYVDVCIK